MKIIYSSYSDYKHWPLSHQDWLNLEKNGWSVDWFANMQEKPVSIREFDCLDSDSKWSKVKIDILQGVWAISASKDFKSIGDAIREFEKITKQDVSETVPFSLSPHCFFVETERRSDFCYSGENLLRFLFKKHTKKTKRQLLEMLNK